MKLSSAQQASERRLAASAADRRRESRSRAVYRLVHVAHERDHERDEGFAICRNISDSGLRLALQIEVAAGDALAIAFSQEHVLKGKVAWVKSGECGVALDRPVDSLRLLAATAQLYREEGGRAPRLRTDIRAKIAYDGQVHVVTVCDVSQRGMKIHHGTVLERDLQLTVMLEGNIAKRAVVRWTRDEHAGLMLLEPFSIDELGSVKAL